MIDNDEFDSVKHDIQLLSQLKGNFPTNFNSGSMLTTEESEQGVSEGYSTSKRQIKEQDKPKASNYESMGDVNLTANVNCAAPGGDNLLGNVDSKEGAELNGQSEPGASNGATADTGVNSLQSSVGKWTLAFLLKMVFQCTWKFYSTGDLRFALLSICPYIFVLKTSYRIITTQGVRVCTFSMLRATVLAILLIIAFDLLEDCIVSILFLLDLTN